MPFFAFLALLFTLLLPQPAAAYSADDLATADKYYGEKSYQLAAAEYEKLLDQKAEPALMREVAFKWGDSVLQAKDEAKRDAAEKKLLELAGGETHDRWWAESGTTLAMNYIEKDPYGKAEEIKKYLDAARDWWAGSSDVELAREKFITTSFALADFITSRWGWYNADIRPIRLNGKRIAPAPQQQPGNAALQVLFEEILKVAKTEEHKAHAHYGLAMSWMQNYSGDQKLRDKAAEEFEKITEDFADSEWADDAWYQLGMLYENQSDFVKAADAYRGIAKRYSAGQSQWLDDAKRRLEYIVNPSMGLSLGNTFIPGSEIQFGLSWRNVKSAQVAFYKLDLPAEIALKNDQSGYSGYQEVLQKLVETGRYKSLPVALNITAALKEEGKHQPYSEYKSLADWRKDSDAKTNPDDGKLAAGAYLMLVTAAGTQPAYDLVLVTDAALVSKVANDRALFFAMDAKTGAPLAGAQLRYTYSFYDDSGNTRWVAGEGKAGDDGLLKVDLRTSSARSYSQQHNVFAAMSSGKGQAFVQNSYYNYYNNGRGEWWLYAFTDRPAYRPNETVNIKAMLRQPKDGGFVTPSGLKVKARIYDAQGKQVKEGDYTLNEYGVLNDTLVLDDKATLGEYSLQLYSADANNQLAAVQLFRLEEYKLPEYTVTVTPAPKTAEKGIAAYRLGDTIDVSVDAQYYFGGPVAEAEVEYLVYQQPLYRYYRPWRAYSWYYDDLYPQNYGYGNGALVVQKKIKTGADGKASFKIETPKDQGDLQFHVEARVVDKSRREIRGTADIKVMKTAFYAVVEAKANLYRPGDKAQALIKTLTADDAPIAVEGKVTIRRNSWRDPVYREDKVVNPGGYDGREIMTKFVKTNDKGEAIFEFEPSENGYYTVEFTGFDNGEPVTAAANIYVCDTDATNIGYRYGGLQIITEKDTYQAGDTARAMIVSDVPDTYVLLTVESDNLYDYRLLHIEGSVKLVELPVRGNYVPNIFLNAVSGGQYQLKTTGLQLIVPPADKFLNVKITSDKAVYQPQEEGKFDIEVTDNAGKLVSGEVAIGITDAAIYYIQDEMAPDIRKFFYGDKKQQSVQTQASFYQRPYTLLVRAENGDLITDQEQERRKSNKDGRNDAPADQLGEADDYRQRGGVGGKADFGVASGAMMKSAPSAAPVAQMAAKEMADKNEMAPEKKAKITGRDEDLKRPEGNAGGLAEPGRVRSDFRSTVTWLPALKTDANGRATVTVTFPDSLTTWRATARAATAETSVGSVTHEVRSNKNLMIRLQAPRFFTERDLVDVSAIIDNMTDKPMKVSPALKAEGLAVTGLYRDGKFVKGEQGVVEVPAHGQARVDWALKAEKAGMAKITVTARGEGAADAMEKTYPIIPHGIEKFIAQSAVLKSAGDSVTKEITVNIPKERIREATSLRLTISPSLAANLLDALPYLADYPYGCVEQTMSRFLPAVIVRKTMTDLGISGHDVDAYISDVLEPRNDPKGHPQRREDATYKRLDKMVTDGLTRLYDFQHADGGWGWWKDGDSDRFMTAYVAWGLGLARDAGLDIRSDVLERAAQYLRVQLVEEENAPDMLAWMLHGISQVSTAGDQFTDKQRNRLWEMREKLNPYTRALFALSENRYGNQERSRVLAQNLINGVDEDKENATAHWGEAGVNYRWSEGGVEATAFTIKALSLMDPQSEYLEKAVKWMVLNRRGASWKNTRDTAIAILGLADYLKATKELAPEYDYTVNVNGKEARKGRADTSNVFSFNRLIDIPAEGLNDGDNKITVTIKGKGALYVAAHAKYFTLEEPIAKAGNEIFVTRKYYKQAVKETLMKGYAEDWAELAEGDAVNSGDRIRVEVTLDAKNNYEYLVAEDYKPAGLEAVSLTSGSGEEILLDRNGKETGERGYVYQEFRDQKAAFFIPQLKQGKHLLRYELRAEVPGEFHAMPDQTHAMYVPEIRANSDEMRVKVND
ncbi:MAG TPA: MG2 domain-containing protein [Patescibacteria group bacterium]|nr:MG2 domain-containing protein [Patescibacteria group bacterium]